ncbi:3-isopropylmalate dehydrogenase [Setomelanomma holmii]|uniref:3-isopropylmalate dehydrogenase n=1 Tax=Setomelanomma holmii TaxID=210430 RepID=A0A9P4GW51_9PLEO|nr:3-isopropylmalate dehydrogenase [Setomelanomma holmii]
MASSQSFQILVIPGDHIGPEVMTEALKVLDTLEKVKPNLKFNKRFDIAGGASIDIHGTPITEEVLQIAANSDAVLFGSVGGPEWEGKVPTPESALLRLRKHLDAFANVRPCKFITSSLTSKSPLKPEIVQGTDIIFVRENCGGAYFGPKVEDNGDYASDTWGYSAEEVARCARVSAAIAEIAGSANGGKPVPVWSADKYNVLANSRLWRRVTEEVFKNEFPHIELRNQLADSMAMHLVARPRSYNGVCHCDNTFGDILSDLAGGVLGTLGMLPSASLSGVPGPGKKCRGIYEPIHGSAPDISGKGIANPIGEILSVAMMLRYSLALPDEAKVVEDAVSYVLERPEEGGLGLVTADLGGNATTVEVGDAVCKRIAELST